MLEGLLRGLSGLPQNTIDEHTDVSREVGLTLIYQAKRNERQINLGEGANLGKKVLGVVEAAQFSTRL